MESETRVISFRRMGAPLRRFTISGCNFAAFTSLPEFWGIYLLLPCSILTGGLVLLPPRRAQATSLMATFVDAVAYGSSCTRTAYLLTQYTSIHATPYTSLIAVNPVDHQAMRHL